jgi:uncharacterized membrane protein YcaP (DUF421 family)
MNNYIISIILKTAIAYVIVFVSAKFVGRKIISQMTFFDFIVGVTLGSVAANLAIGQKRSFLSMSIVLIVFAILALLSDVLHIKSKLFRTIVDSKPEILIMNGQINGKNLKKTRFTIDELTTQLREKNVFNISDVEFAIIESDGKLSVLPKSQKQPLTPSDINLPTSYKGLTKDIIVDGKVKYEALKQMNLDEKWLNGQLKTYGIDEFEKILYAGLDTSGNLYISKKNNNNFLKL